MAKNEEVTRSASSTDVEPPEGSPIIIGGGAGGGPPQDPIIPKPVFCDFDDRVYIDPDPQGNPRRKRFENRDLAIRSLILKIQEDSMDLSALLPNTGRGEIEIKCPGFDNDLKIFGNPLGIEFHTGTYPPQQGTQRRQSANSFPSRLEIDFDGFSFEKSLNPNDDWSIKVDYVPQN